LEVYLYCHVLAVSSVFQTKIKIHIKEMFCLHELLLRWQNKKGIKILWWGKYFNIRDLKEVGSRKHCITVKVLD